MPVLSRRSRAPFAGVEDSYAHRGRQRDRRGLVAIAQPSDPSVKMPRRVSMIGRRPDRSESGPITNSSDTATAA